MRFFGRKKKDTDEKAKTGPNRGGSPGASSVGGSETRPPLLGSSRNAILRFLLGGADTTVFRLQVPKNVRPGENDESTLVQLMVQDWFPPAMMQYLNSEDALSFSMASRATRVVRLGPTLNLERSFEKFPRHWWGKAKIWQTLPSLRSPAYHSVFLKCRWSDQGWGNRKGMLSVVNHGGTAPDDFERPSNCVVSYREPAPHCTMPLVLSFCPDAEDEAKHPYSIWARGGGHQLIVKDLSMRILTYTKMEDSKLKSTQLETLSSKRKCLPSPADALFKKHAA